MKKVISMVLSIIMMLSVTSGIGLTAYANTIDKAIPLTFDVVTKGTLNASNKHVFYKVVLPSSGKLTMTFKNYDNTNYFGRNWAGWGIGGQCNGGYVIYDQNYENFYENYAYYSTAFDCPYLKDTLFLNKGTYYIEEDTNNDSTYYGKYEILVNFTPSNESYPETYAQTFNNIDVANSIELNKKYFGQICDYNDFADYYKFNIPISGKITISSNFSTENMEYRRCLYIYDYADPSTAVYSTELSTEINPYNVNIELKKGTYCFVYSNSYSKGNGGTYDFKISYSPNISKPSALKVASRKTTSIKLSWKKASGVNGYEVQKKTGGKWKSVANTTSNSYTISKLKAGIGYDVRVRSYKTISGKKYYSSFATLKAVTKPATPKIKAPSTNSKHEIKVNWSPVSSATGYQVQFAKNKSCSKVIATRTVKGKNKKTYTGKNFTKGRTYYVRVRSYKTVNGKKYYSSWSAAKAIKSK